MMCHRTTDEIPGRVSAQPGPQRRRSVRGKVGGQMDTPSSLFFYSARCHVSCHEAQSRNKKNGREEQKVYHFTSLRAFSQEIVLYLTRNTNLIREKRLLVPC